MGRGARDEPSCRQIVKSANRQVGKQQRIATGEQRVASSFVWQCSCIAENFGLTTALSTSHSDWAHREVRPPKRRKNSALREICQIPCPLSRAPCPSLAEASGIMHAYTPARRIVIDDENLSADFSRRKSAVTGTGQGL